ncbi:FecR family protein [Marinimicrobium sp. ARAG 43.8]|uniref:FecR family protein n=1 Tax=Marinimicrobium sp. ARAG 43.8 TaxID=3418719 RepID=UPI003CF54257
MPPLENRPSEQAGQETIDQQAAEWVTRLAGGGIERSEQQQLSRWLAEDARHREAFTQSQQVWRAMGALREPLVSEAVIESRVTRCRHFRWSAGVAAASVLMVLCVQLWLSGAWPTGRESAADYATAPGEQQTVTLRDGSRVRLGPDSAIAVAYDADFRRVNLVSGVAYFTVAAERGAGFRPFVVEAGSLSGTALGTRFVVDRLAGTTAELTVIEHAVAVSTPATHTPVNVDAGQRVRVQGAQLDAPVSADPGWAKAWKHNQLVFERTSLKDVITRLNRFRTHKIILSRSEASQIRVSGVFDPTDSDQVVNALAKQLDLKVYRIPPFLTILR